MASAVPILPQEGRTIRVRGLVQGVGFRPTVWRLARVCGLVGQVWNDAAGVMIEAWGDPADLDRFVSLLKIEPPPLARIDAIVCGRATGSAFARDFNIAPSRGGGIHTGIVPDAATCTDCLVEIADPGDRRHHYPFANCTHCGPRLSIVEAVPYDRAHTSMKAFALCADCRSEYEDPGDRRFHAQPMACPACGPEAWLERLGAGGAEPIDSPDAVANAAELLDRGAIVAIKGLGGFHLACDAANEDAVARLRARKRRYDKPFALMARDLTVVSRYCDLNEMESAALNSTAAPIVVLDIRDSAGIGASVAPRQATLGFMLPYTPLHYLLMRSFDRPLVMTSGNVSEQPQCIGNGQARTDLADIADYALLSDRAIVNRLDDSVVRLMDGEMRMLRRARGYAPAPIILPEGFSDAPPLLALGGELKSSFCLLRDGEAIVSQHLGDLENAATFDDYRRALDLYADLFGHAPAAIAVDAHPDYLSAKLGRAMAMEQSLPIAEIQHHHAHIASCLAENGIALDAPPVLGIALDGLGYGGDGSLWGGEFLRADYRKFDRLGRFAQVVMPGGPQAVRQPWRNTYAHLAAAIGWDAVHRDYGDLDLIRYLETKPLATLDAMARKHINSPHASSCGRLFDAVAAAAGLCRDVVSYEGQAAIELEAAVDADTLARGEVYSIAIRDGDIAEFHFAPLWCAILADLASNTPAGVIAARFHAGLAQAIVAMARRLLSSDDSEIRTVALSGGSFQNRTLLERVSQSLEADGVRVLTQRRFPANDGGLALGQAAIAAAHHIDALSSHGATSLCA